MDKRRITYKDEGDGFQCDALAQDGWTHQVYFRNEPAPAQYLRMGLSPLHARVMWLFDCVQHKWHVCGLDNLYNSAKFCRTSYVQNKVLINGVTRVGGRGLPSSVLQQPITNKKEQMAARGTVKAAVLKGDAECPNLVATSVYDTKPVHFLSTVCESIKWIVKERPVFNVDSGRVEKIWFLRLNVNDFYNHAMGNVDVSDQLRNTYRFDHWLRKRKWWWSILFWWIGVMLVNAYVYYISVNIAAGVKRKDLLSHHDFRKAVALSWINQPLYWTPQKKPTRKEQKQYEGPSMSKKKMAADPSTRSQKRMATDNLSPVDAGKKRRRAKVTDAAMSQQGSYGDMRLNRSFTHFPIPVSGRVRCMIHRWCNVEKFGGVVECEDCKVTLCLACYKMFHTCNDMMANKKELMQQFHQEKEEMTISRQSKKKK